MGEVFRSSPCRTKAEKARVVVSEFGSFLLQLGATMDQVRNKIPHELAHGLEHRGEGCFILDLVGQNEDGVRYEPHYAALEPVSRREAIDILLGPYRRGMKLSPDDIEALGFNPHETVYFEEIEA